MCRGGLSLVALYPSIRSVLTDREYEPCGGGGALVRCDAVMAVVMVEKVRVMWGFETLRCGGAQVWC